MTQHITTHDAIKLAEFIMDGGARIFEGLPPANPVKFSPARTSLTVAKARDLKAAQYFRGAGMVDCATIHTHTGGGRCTGSAAPGCRQSVHARGHALHRRQGPTSDPKSLSTGATEQGARPVRVRALWLGKSATR